MTRSSSWLLSLVALFVPAVTHGEDAPLRSQATEGLKKACQFFSTEVATEGG